MEQQWIKIQNEISQMLQDPTVFNNTDLPTPLFKEALQYRKRCVQGLLDGTTYDCGVEVQD